MSFQNDTDKKIYKRSYDFSLLIITLFLVAIGLVVVYSTSSYTGMKKFSDPAKFLKRQGLSAALGIVTMFIISLVDYRIYIVQIRKFFNVRLVYGLYLLSLGLQGIVLLIGDEVYGAKRWIDLPVIGSFQPSELSKICVIIWIAFMCSRKPKKMNSLFGLFCATFWLLPVILLVAKEDLSTAIVMFAIMFVVCFVTSRKWWMFIATGVLSAGAAAAYIFLGKGFRTQRIEAWLNVDTDPGALQIRRGLYAISSGGLLGKGLGESSMKLGYVPEAHNDMIFSIICEEHGLLGAVVLILVFVLLLWRIYAVAVNAPDLFGTLLCVGVMTHIGIQLIMNIAVVTNVIPCTGIALPFISYGGTSLIFLLCEIGIVLSVSFRIEAE